LLSVLITGSRSKIPNPLPCVANGKIGALNAGQPGVGGNDRGTAGWPSGTIGHRSHSIRTLWTLGGGHS
jgi:hypothetical protein